MLKDILACNLYVYYDLQHLQTQEIIKKLK